MLLIFVLLFSTSIYAQDGRSVAYSPDMLSSAAADSLEMNMYGDILVEVGGIRQAVDFSSVIAASLAGDDIEMNMNLSVPVLQQLIGASNIQLFINDGFAYLGIQGFKVKVKIPTDSASIYPSGSSEIVAEFTEDMLQIQSMNMTPEGHAEISFFIDGDTLNDIPVTAIETYMDGKIYKEEIPLNFDDMTLSRVMTPAGELVSLRLIYGFSSAVSGIQMRASYDMTAQIQQLGGVTVNFPADLDSYVDVTGIVSMYI
jgi:hypothetical protein